MYEKFSQKPIPRKQFSLRVFRHLLLAGLILIASLLVGTLGFVHYAQLGWQSAFLNSSLLLSGIGLGHFPDATSGQLFVSIYALYAGLVYLVTSGIILAPVVHRLLHHFHWSED